MSVDARIHAIGLNRATCWRARPATCLALAGCLVAGVCAVLAPRAAAQDPPAAPPAPPPGGGVAIAQPFLPSNRGIPSVEYWMTMPLFLDGDYREALDGFKFCGRGAKKTAASRWLDSICYHTMVGECYYQMGQNRAALAQYTQSLTLYLRFADWMTRVTFNQGIRPANPGQVVTVFPWGAPQRNFAVGRYPDGFPILQGQVNNNQVVQQGGVVQPPSQVDINVQEIVRCTCLAIRRRGELLGPAARYDPLFSDVVTGLRSNPQTGHWSQVWIDTQLGVTYAALGQDGRALTMLERSIVAGGQFDHPLTPTVLLELGRLALRAGDFVLAGNTFMEATYSAVNFGDIGVLEEAFRMAALTHQLTSPEAPCAPLALAANWARVKRYRQLQVSLLTLAAENACTVGPPQQAVALIGQARNLIGRRWLGGGKLAARMNYTLALGQFETGNVAAGQTALAAALNFQNASSLWLFHITLADELWATGDVGRREANELYRIVLRDPTPADWMTDPLECLSVLMTPHTGAYERWFHLVNQSENEAERAFEIAELCKRHRFLNTLDLGGRLLNLRWLLEGPIEMLDEQGRVDRDDLFTRYPAYDRLSKQAAALRAGLKQLKLNLDDKDQAHDREIKLQELAQVSLAQEAILLALSLRREHCPLVFPPVKTRHRIQEGLAEGEAVLSFFSTGDGLFAFLMGHKDTQYRGWLVGGAPAAHEKVSALLREMGNHDHNRELKIEDLQDDKWKSLAKDMYQEIFTESAAQLPLTIKELVVIPDGVAWYVPFEALQVSDGAGGLKPLISKMRLRYAPLAALGVADPRKRRQVNNTAVALGKLYPGDEDQVALDAFDEFQRTVPGAEAIAGPLPAPSALFGSLLDRLVVFDEVKGPDRSAYGWFPLKAGKSPVGATLGDWMALPWGAPEIVLLPGFRTAAENSLKKQSLAADGADLFLSTCGMMATGARTILVSRWRTGGQTSYNLVREFAGELPNAPAAECWQRSVLLAKDAPLDKDAEPRVRQASNKDLATAEHPFFWAGYMLIDSGVTPVRQVEPPPGAVVKAPGKLKPAFGGAGAKMDPMDGAMAENDQGPPGPRAKGIMGAGKGDEPDDGMAADPNEQPKGKRGKGRSGKKDRKSNKKNQPKEPARVDEGAPPPAEAAPPSDENAAGAKRKSRQRAGK